MLRCVAVYSSFVLCVTQDIVTKRTSFPVSVKRVMVEVQVQAHMMNYLWWIKVANAGSTLRVREQLCKIKRAVVQHELQGRRRQVKRIGESKYCFAVQRMCAFTYGPKATSLSLLT